MSRRVSAGVLMMLLATEAVGCSLQKDQVVDCSKPNRALVLATKLAPDHSIIDGVFTSTGKETDDIKISIEQAPALGMVKFTFTLPGKNHLKYCSAENYDGARFVPIGMREGAGSKELILPYGALVVVYLAGSGQPGPSDHWIPTVHGDKLLPDGMVLPS